MDLKKRLSVLENRILFYPDVIIHEDSLRLGRCLVRRKYAVIPNGYHFLEPVCHSILDLSLIRRQAMLLRGFFN